MGGGTDSRTEGRKDGRTDGHLEIPPCPTGHRPFWAAAQIGQGQGQGQEEEGEMIAKCQGINMTNQVEVAELKSRRNLLYQKIACEQ